MKKQGTSREDLWIGTRGGSIQMRDYSGILIGEVKSQRPDQASAYLFSSLLFSSLLFSSLLFSSLSSLSSLSPLSSLCFVLLR